MYSPHERSMPAAHTMVLRRDSPMHAAAAAAAAAAHVQATPAQHAHSAKHGATHGLCRGADAQGEGTYTKGQSHALADDQADGAYTRDGCKHKAQARSSLV